MHVYDKDNQRNSLSGINDTVFGASGTLGLTIGAMLGRIGTTVIYPYRNTGTEMISD